MDKGGELARLSEQPYTDFGDSNDNSPEEQEDLKNAACCRM